MPWRSDVQLRHGLDMDGGEGWASPRTLVDDARVELDGDGVADDVAQETRRVLALALRDVAVLHGGGGPL